MSSEGNSKTAIAGRQDTASVPKPAAGQSPMRSQEVEDLLFVLSQLDDEDTIFALLEDLFTIREIRETSQRLAVARLLAAGKSYAAIERITGASATTIARVSKCLSYGTGGYAAALSLLDRQDVQE